MASSNHSSPVHKGAGRFLIQYAHAWHLAQTGRHVLWMLVVLGAAWLLIAVVDWQVSLTENWRVAAAILLYGTVIGLSVRFMVRFKQHDSWREYALQVEEEVPELQGRLLAACELPCEAELSRRDSLAFREELHGEVTRKLAQIRPQSLVSWRGCRRPALALLLLALLWAGFSIAISPAWAGRLWSRAMGDSLPRIPGLVVALESPKPLQPGQPAGIFAEESVRVIARTNLPGVLRATVETRPVQESGGTAKNWRMRSAPGQGTAFSTSFVMPPAAIEVRAVADDAASDWLRLEPARPARIDRLAYATAEAPQSKTETTGLITLLKPGEITLEIHTAQPVKGQLELMQNQQKTVVPLSEDAGGLLRAQFPVAVSGTYALRLEDPRTGLRTDVPVQPIEVRKEPEVAVTPETNPPVNPNPAEAGEVIPEEPYGKRVRAYLSVKPR